MSGDIKPVVFPFICQRSARRLSAALLLAALLAGGPLVWGAEGAHPTRPIVRAVLKDGTTVEGVLIEFSQGVYVLKVAGGRRAVREADLGDISFHSQGPAPAEARSVDPELVRLIGELRRAARERRPPSPAVIAGLAKTGTAAVEPLLAAARGNSHLARPVAQVLREMDPAIRPTLIGAVRRDGSHGIRLAVQYVFSEEGVTSVGALAKLLDERSTSMRRFAVDTLYSIGIQAGNNLPPSLAKPLIKAIRDRNPGVQGQAVLVLARVGLSSDATLPALLRELKTHGQPATRRQIVIALGRVSGDLKADGARFKGVLDALSTALLKDPSESVRSYAAMYLAYMGAKARPALPAVRRALDDNSARVRHYAQEAADFIEASQTNPMRLRHYDARFAAAAAERHKALREVAGLHKETLALIERFVGRGSAISRAAQAKLTAKEPSPELLAALMAAVRADQTNYYWPRVASLLAAWGDKARAPLARYSGDQHYRVRRTVVVAWGRMNHQILPKAMARLLDDQHVWVRLSTAESLSRLSQHGSPKLAAATVPLLIEALRDETIQRTGWWSGSSAVAELAPTFPEAIDALIKSMKTAQRAGLRGSAARSLSRVGRQLREDHQHVSRIVGALAQRIDRERDDRTRVAIIRALGYMGKRAGDAAAALRKATDDPTAQVAKAAREALAKIEN